MRDGAERTARRDILVSGSSVSVNLNDQFYNTGGKSTRHGHRGQFAKRAARYATIHSTTTLAREKPRYHRKVLQYLIYFLALARVISFLGVSQPSAGGLSDCVGL